MKRTKTARISGIDFSDAYVDYAKRTVLDPRAQFRVGDICAVPYDNASFDRVLSLLVLHFVPDTRKAVAELRRIARPGATVGAAVWDAGGVVAYRMIFNSAAALYPSADERRSRNLARPMTRPGELAAAWRAAGLIDVRDTMLTIRMDFASFGEFVLGPPMRARMVPVPSIWQRSMTARGAGCGMWFVLHMLPVNRTVLDHSQRLHGQSPGLSPRECLSNGNVDPA